MRIKASIDGRDITADVPAEWLKGSRGWELIGGELGREWEGGADAAMPDVRDAVEADTLPTVRASKAAKKER